jgi:hypothetical protein
VVAVNFVLVNREVIRSVSESRLPAQALSRTSCRRSRRINPDQFRLFATVEIVRVLENVHGAQESA